MGFLFFLPLKAFRTVSIFVFLQVRIRCPGFGLFSFHCLEHLACLFRWKIQIFCSGTFYIYIFFFLPSHFSSPGILIWTCWSNHTIFFSHLFSFPCFSVSYSLEISRVSFNFYWIFVFPLIISKRWFSFSEFFFFLNSILFLFH